MNEKESIKEALDKIGKSFSELDIGAWLDCFYQPRIIVFPHGAIAPASEKECREMLGGYIDKLRSLGFSHTTLNEFNVQFLTSTTAIAGTVWTRYAQDKVLERIGSTYLFLKTGDRWLATMVTLHPETVRVVTEQR